MRIKAKRKKKKKKEKRMDVFPSASVPVSAVVRLAAVEEGVLGARNLKFSRPCD